VTARSGTFLDYTWHRMEKIGITHHLGHVSPVFDVARNLLSVSIKDGQAEGREEVTLQTTDPFLRAQELRSLGMDVVVCGAISRPYETALSTKGIKVIGSICGPLEEVLWAFLNGTLEDAKFLMPGFGGLRRWRGRYGKKRQ
jgi:predicted Fe-Mo cluster-binding NifX family protein